MIEIGDKIFKTKKAAEDYIRSILYKYELGESLAGEDLIFICSVLELHPDKDEKIGVGLKSIIVEKETTYNKTAHFSVVRVDNSKEDFSFKKCINLSLNDPIKLFQSSARRAVVDQILSFRDNEFLQKKDMNGNMACAITGVLISKNTSHVDHVPPKTFKSIVLDFIAINSIDVKDSLFTEAPGGIGRVFVDDNIKNSFADYHRRVAKLRVVSPFGNLSQKKK